MYAVYFILNNVLTFRGAHGPRYFDNILLVSKGDFLYIFDLPSSTLTENEAVIVMSSPMLTGELLMMVADSWALAKSTSIITFK